MPTKEKQWTTKGYGARRATETGSSSQASLSRWEQLRRGVFVEPWDDGTFRVDPDPLGVADIHGRVIAAADLAQP